MKCYCILCLSICFILFGCGNNNQQQAQAAQSQVVVTSTAGLDLQALGEIVKTSHDAAEIEQRVNVRGGVNNLDLNNDGNVDYIFVNEYDSNGTRGFSFVVDNNGTKQEVADIQVASSGTNATLIIIGNRNIYGDGCYYNNNYLLADLLIWNYMWRPHQYYVSPYHYGYYPRYYRRYRTRPYIP